MPDSTDWNPRDAVGTIAKWLDEALDYARDESTRRAARRRANLELYRRRGTCPLGHPIFVTADRSVGDQGCGYCYNARHENIEEAV